MGSKPITARAAAKVYANSVAKSNGTPSAGSYVNVSGQAHKLNDPQQVGNFYTGGNEALIKGASRVTGSMPGKKMSDAAWKKYLANETEEQRSKRYKREEAAGVRETEPDKVVKGDGYTTTITKQDTTPVEETRDTYKPWEINQAMRAVKKSDRFVRQAQRKYDKGRISLEQLNAAKALREAAAEAPQFGRNPMQSSTYNRPKSGEGLPEYQGGETKKVTYDNGDTYTITDSNPYGYNAELGRGVPLGKEGSKAKTNPTKKDGPAAYSPKTSVDLAKDRLATWDKNANDKAKSINFFDGKDQSIIKSTNAALDFAGNAANNNFSNAPYSAYIDKTGQYRDNELEKAMSSAFNKNGKPASYTMGGFASKANKKK